MFLAGFNYVIEYRKINQHGDSDGLSRLPLKKAYDKETVDPVETFQLSQIQVLPVSADMIRQATQRDSILLRMMGYTKQGWSAVNEKELEPFYKKKDKLTMQDGCLMSGSRILIPPKHQNTKHKCDELYDDHLGVTKIKALARSYVWWPGIDKAIEQESKRFTGCPLTLNNPKIAPLHSWEWPARPWQRIYVYLAGPFLGTMFLVVVDAHSKWPEAIPMATTNTTTTIKEPRKLFTARGLPEQLVSE